MDSIYKVAGKDDSKLLNVVIYTDADFANAINRKCRSEVCVFVNDNQIDLVINETIIIAIIH